MAIHKVRTLRFHSFRRPSPPARVHKLLAYTLFPLVQVYRYHFLKKDMTDIICELLSIKAPQTMLQNKKSFCTKLKENIESKLQKSPGIEFALFNYTEEMRMDNFGCLSSSLSLFLFCNESAKKKITTFTLPLIGANTLLAGPPLPPSEHA